ncbi:MAG: SRPBCC family protein [Pseudomonadota bacterium]
MFRNRTLLAGVALALTITTAGATRAGPLPREAVAALGAGQPWAEVTLDPAGDAALIRAAIDISAPPDRIWRAMTDCGSTLRMVTSIVQCRVVRAGPGWDIREHVTKSGPLLPSFRYLVRSDYEQLRRIRFRRLEGDVKRLDGEWELISLSGGRTRVIYENHLSAPILAPAFMVRAKLRRDTPKVLENLRRLAAGG